MSPEFERWLRRGALATSVALAASFVATSTVVVWPRVSRSVGIKPAPPPPAYRVGQMIDTPLEWTQATPVSLVLFAQSSCGACQKAEPFLKTLFADVKGKATVVLTSHGPERADELAYGHALGLEDGAIKVTPKGLRVQATPTLVLVDRRGRILDTWEGVGPSSQQKLIREKILSQLTTND